MSFVKVVKKLHLFGVLRSINFFLLNRVFAGSTLWGVKRFLLRLLGNKIGKGTKIVGPIFCSAQLNIGENCWVGRNLQINGNGIVNIGNNCDIAPSVTFFTGGHKIADSFRRAGEGETYTITLGSGCWVGGNSTFLRDIEIKAGCVIAAGAVVTKSFDKNNLIGGVPAKIIKEL